jgi:hypothetical protein
MILQHACPSTLVGLVVVSQSRHFKHLIEVTYHFALGCEKEMYNSKSTRGLSQGGDRAGPLFSCLLLYINVYTARSISR